MLEICDAVKQQTFDMVSCFESNLGTEVCTPFSYPDGEAITVTVKSDGDGFVVHDGGMAAMNLGKNGQSFTKKIAHRTESFAGLYGCEIRNQRVYRACTMETLSGAIYTVASVCNYVGSHIPFDLQKKAKFEAKVIEILGAKIPATQIEYKTEVTGQTGKIYKATAVIKFPKSESIAAVIEAVSGGRAVNSKFRSFYDIKNNISYKDVKRISVYDDIEDFSEGDIPLLQDVSNTVPFAALSQRIELYAQ